MFLFCMSVNGCLCMLPCDGGDLLAYEQEMLF